MRFGSFFFCKALMSCCADERPFIIAKQHVNWAVQVWAADKLKKKETLPSWMATVSCKVAKTECALHIPEILAGEDKTIQRSICTFRPYQVANRSVGVHHVSSVSVNWLMFSSFTMQDPTTTGRSPY